MNRTKKLARRSTCLLLTLLLMVSPILSSTDLGTTAQALTYRTGANGPAATYKASKYYTHATSINLTGDSVTDVLALALSQLGYYEGTASNPYSGLYNTYDTYSTNKTTEYVYNYGDADSSGYKMAWCASFCSWAIFQAGVTNHSTHAQSCRNHIGDKNYIWRECSCYQWADQLKRFNMYYARGSYTPKAGDLIFFKMDGGSTAWTNHIGLVLYSDGSRVYTIEGNRHNHVGLHNYSLSDSQICGYGVLPWPSSDPDVPKVDYTGKNKTAGQYITNNATLAVSSTKGGSTAFSVGKYEMFEVTGFDGGYAKVSYGGKTGYATLSSTTIQVTAKADVAYSMDASVVTTNGQTSGYMGGSKLPDSNNSFENPNVLVEGLRENTNNYKGLENYGTNKDKIIINGRTLSKWESRSDTPIINNIWVYSAGDGKAYLGIDIADTSKLRVKGRDGTGEEIESIVIGRGFEIVSTTSDRWSAGEISADDANIDSVVGVFKENVVLTAVDNIYFNVTLGGSNSLGLDGLNFTTANEQVVKINYGCNIRLSPNTAAYALGFGNPGDTFEYLGEMRNNWYMVDYNGHVCWISGDSASLIDKPRTVTLTADANVRSGPDTTYSVLGVGLAGATFEYLNETQNTKWLKVNYNGATGWVSNVNATLSAQTTVVSVTAENADWTEGGTDTGGGTGSGTDDSVLSKPIVGIDVSSWNQEIDWAKVKDAGVEFAIIRMFHHIENTPNYELDEQFERNVSEAQKYGIELGVYFFSYAQDLAAVATEANMVVSELRKYPGVFSFPVVFDAETGDTTDDPDVEGNDIYDIGSFAGDACKTFCDIVAANGYYPMVYSFTWYFKNTIGLENVKDYDLWLASWPRGTDGTTQIYAGTTPAQAGNVDHSKRDTLSSYDGNVTMWQYTGAGSCDGILYGDGGNANVDLNICYVDYPSIIKRGGYNGYATMNAALATASEGTTYAYWGGSILPSENCNFENPNFMVTGLRENTNNYKGLENYGTNKDKIIINGRTLSKWESRPGDPIINNIWVYTGSDGKTYMGIDITDTSRLHVKGRAGTGEEIKSIVIKRGFEIVKTDSDLWSSGEISTNTGTVVGVFKENVVLTAVDNLTFNLTTGGSDSLGINGVTFTTAPAQLVQVTAGTNIRTQPDASYSAIAFGNAGDTFEYLGEVRNSSWYMVDCNGQVGWISGACSTLIDVPRTVTLTADANIRSGPDTTYSALGVGLAGAKFEYLNETQNTKWMKVNYNGQVGWVSNVNATLGAQTTVVNVAAGNNGWVTDAAIPVIDGGQTYAYWGGSILPSENCNFENPNFMVTGLGDKTNSYKGLENYGTNKDKIIINGRTLSKWESRPGDPIINNIWVYTGSDGKTYMGIDIADTAKLHVKGRDGTGEEIESIVFKRGFEIVKTDSDLWSNGEISADTGTVVGVFEENVVLTAIDNLTFNVTLGGSNELGLDGYTFESVAPQVVEITVNSNIRSGPGSSYAAVGFGYVGESYEYLNETRNDWYMVNCNGKVGWVAKSNASLIASTGTTNVVLVTAENKGWEEDAVADISLATVNGAQIRTSGTQGLRFISSIDTTTADFSRVVEYGTLLIPSADITDISELQIGATLNGHAVAKVTAKNLYDVTDNTITFTAVITNIAEKNYAREYTARAYAILDDGSVVYADTGASRSIYAVAKRGLESATESIANKAIFQAIVDAVDGDSGSGESSGIY